MLAEAALALGLAGPSDVCSQVTPPRVTTPADSYSEEKGAAPVIEVFLPTVVNERASLVTAHAKGIATDIFRKIGVNVRWQTAYAAHARCSEGPSRRTILAAFSWNTPSQFHPGALAYASPYNMNGACMTVFLDRLEPMIEASPSGAASLLGHVLAHEMGHILKGTAQHSESGVLKGRWSQSEIREMGMHNLSFTDYDRSAILSGIGVTARQVHPHSERSQESYFRVLTLKSAQSDAPNNKSALNAW